MAQITLNSSGVASSGSLLLQTNGTTTQATVDTSGNLGLGVTPSAWGTYIGVLDLKGNGALAAYNQSINLSANSYYNGTNWIYKATTSAGQYQIAGNVHQWYNAASGTAGNAITFTQAMTLDASGNLGVGTTSPTVISNYKSVTVNGTTGSLVDLASNGTVGLRLQCDTTYPGGAFFTLTNQPMIFGTNGTERARIDTSGNLLVGTTSNLGRLSVVGSTADNTAYALGVRNSSSTDMFQVRNDGYIITGNAAASPYNNTSASAANMIVTSGGGLARSTSALKYKDDVRDLEAVNISSFRPVRYKSKCENDDKTIDHIGFIADEYIETYPELVSFGDEGQVEGFAYERMTAILCKAIQEQQAIITQLQADVQALKG